MSATMGLMFDSLVFIKICCMCARLHISCVHFGFIVSWQLWLCRRNFMSFYAFHSVARAIAADVVCLISHIKCATYFFVEYQWKYILHALNICRPFADWGLFTLGIVQHTLSPNIWDFNATQKHSNRIHMYSCNKENISNKKEGRSIL